MIKGQYRELGENKIWRLVLPLCRTHWKPALVTLPSLEKVIVKDREEKVRLMTSHPEKDTADKTFSRSVTVRVSKTGSTQNILQTNVVF